MRNLLLSVTSFLASRVGFAGDLEICEICWWLCPPFWENHGEIITILSISSKSIVLAWDLEGKTERREQFFL